MTTKKNDPKDVSTVRGVKGGYMFVAPYGTKLPTDYSTALDDAFVNVGFVSSDGWSEKLDIDTSDAINDVNGDTTVPETRTSTKESISFTLISLNKDSAAVQYGAKNVTDGNGLMVIKHNWGNMDDNWSVVLELVLKNNRRMRKVIPEGSVTGLDDLSMNSSDVMGREVTVSYAANDNGETCIDYIQSTETTAAASGAGK